MWILPKVSLKWLPREQRQQLLHHNEGKVARPSGVRPSTWRKEKTTEEGVVRYFRSFSERERGRGREPGKKGARLKQDGERRAEQSSWRRLNKSHYKLASAGCAELTNSLYIKTNRPPRFLPAPG